MCRSYVRSGAERRMVSKMKQVGSEEGLVAEVTDDVPTGHIWRKSSFSNYNGNCVEVAQFNGGLVGLRDTKQHGRGPVLYFSAVEWTSFVASVRVGHFDGA